jgi:hypothetical protein
MRRGRGARGRGGESLHLGGLLGEIDTSLHMAGRLEKGEERLGTNDAHGHVVVLCRHNVVEQGCHGGGGDVRGGNAGEEGEGVRGLAAVVPAVAVAVDCG